MSGRVEIAAGARQTEARLIELIAEHRDAARRDPSLLATALRVIVPSRSLRLHLGERLTAELGAVAGVVLQTLHGAAVEILERSGGEPPGADGLIEILVRRRAWDEPALRAAFEPFLDGFRSVVGAVRDLLDAGFEPELEEGLIERVEALSAARDEKARALATVRTAARVARELEARGLGGRAELLRRARECFERDPEHALPSRGLIVHGFADATGRATDLLEAFARKFSATVLIDHPADPDADDGVSVDLGAAYTERLLERFEGALGRPVLRERAADRVSPDLFRAPGAHAEVREVARRVRTLIEGGARAERIGVVARDLGQYRVALRTQFDRLGIPASALRLRAPLDGAGRRILALADVLESRGRTPSDRWLDAVQRMTFERAGESEGSPEEVTRGASARLRLGLRVVGAARLADMATTVPAEHVDAKDKDRRRLPIRTGLGGTTPGRVGEPPESRRSDGTKRSFHAPQARLHGWELRGVVRAAKALERRFARWPERASLERHLVELEKLRKRDLGWLARDRAEQRVRPVLQRIAEALGDEEITAEEFTLFVCRELVTASEPALAGDGGGVQVLEAMEARARTFDHLFLMGLNRDVFPSVVREDALLGDDVRRALVDVLPDMPVKARARDEDRYLFAQLVSSSPAVALSWQMADEDGKPRVVSPLVERLLREIDEQSVAAVPPILSPAAATHGPHTAHEHAILAALLGGRTALEGHLPAALAQADGRAPADGPTRPDGLAETRALADVRARVLAAWDLGPFEPQRLAPWLGFLGSQEDVGVRPDPRDEAPYVTRLEGQATCPWQTVLTKLLRLEDSPDPLDNLPELDPRILGIVVHEVLQRIVEDELGVHEDAGLEDCLARTPRPVPWPAPERLDALLTEVVGEHVRRERKPTVGWVRSIAEVVRPALERARQFFESEASRFGGGVLGVEVEGRASVPREGRSPIEVVFRADRVERVGERLVLTDLKTAKPIDAKKFRSEGMPRGVRLQPMAYALSAQAHAPEARVHGRYLFLGDGPDDAQRDVGLGERLESHLPDVAAAVDILVESWVAGLFFPRLSNPDGDSEPEACRWCDVSQACVRGDSGARRALVSLARSADVSDWFEALWDLAAAKREEAKA